MQSRYREITVAGSPRDMGRQIGEAARDEIRGFCEVALQRVNKTVRVSRKAAYSIAERSLPFAEEYAPHLVEELRGTADAAGVSLIDLMLLQVRNQLKPEADAGCTSLSVANTSTGNPIVAQNWDNDPLLEDFTIVLTRRPVGKPATMCVTQAGLIAYIGLSDAGVAACLNTLPAPSRDVGVPHYFTLRGLYEADSLDGCVHAIERAHRAIPANIMLGTPQGPANLEVTIDRVHTLRPDRVADAASVGTNAGSVRHEWITHTNHCQHADLCAINDDFPELIQSRPRKSRIDALLSECGDVVAVEDVQRALRDHAGHPRSICRHANDDADTGFWQTVFSVIIEPGQRRMHVTRGTPCDRPFETYCLSD